jgi:NADH dehydrogenase I D subunit
VSTAVEERLQSALGGLAERVYQDAAGESVAVVAPANLRKAVETLKASPELDCDYLSFVCAQDMVPRVPRFDGIYQLYSTKHHHWFRLRVPVDDGKALPSLAKIHQGADWHERETYDLFGIPFDGHPDLRRILLTDNWHGHPLRKEYDHRLEPVWAPGTNVLQNVAEEGMAGHEAGGDDPAKTIVLNLGPQHPATHGVMRLAVELDGENIVGCVPHIGYLHTGIEKLSEHNNWTQNITHYARMDYLSPMNNELAYCLAVEKLLSVEVPKRAQYIRVLMSELTRIISHLVWLGTHAMDMGALSVFLYCFAEREKILEMYEAIGGQRMMTSYIRIGGVQDDMPESFPAMVEAWEKDFDSQLSIYHGLLTKNPIWRQRTMGIGVMDRDASLSYGLSGPLARAVGIDWDLRRDSPYSSFEEFEFDVPVEQSGDVYARYLVRMEELHQSRRIVLQALKKIADTEPGTYVAEDYKLAPVPRDGINASIEELIHHFKYWTDGIWVPPGEAYGFIEASKGELGYFVVSDGTAHPQRVKIRGPSFSNLSAFPEMIKGHLIADVVATIGSIDIVLGEVDR